MRTLLLMLSLAGTLLPLSAWPLAGQGRGAMETRIWMDRGSDPVLQAGDQVRVYYRASSDAYVALFHVSTDGVLRLLFPGGPDQPHRVRGGRDYRLLFSEASQWTVQESPGVGYFFALASSQPFSFRELRQIPGSGEWQLTAQGIQLRQDPYVEIDAVTRALLPARPPGSMALDFVAYHVGQAYAHPRFLCYGCHAVEPFVAWNPYAQSCPSVRVVIYNDPYFYPASRYQGSRVVFPAPLIPGVAQFAVRDRAPGEMGTPVVLARGAAPAPPPLLPSAFRASGGGTETVPPPRGFLPTPGEPTDRPVLERRTGP